MKIKDLEKIGLFGRKAKVYLAILEQGRATAIDIAIRTGIKRTSVYDLVFDLENQGYVSEAKRGARRVFIAEEPNTLVSTFEQRLSEAKDVIPSLVNMYETAISKPRLRFYEGSIAAKHIMEELLNVRNKEQLFWSSISDLIDVFGEPYIRKWAKRRIKRGIWSTSAPHSKSKGSGSLLAFR